MRSLSILTLLALVSSTTFALTPALAVDASKCGPDAPEGYKRPGGYCEQIGANSLVSDGDSKSDDNSAADDGPEDQ